GEPPSPLNPLAGCSFHPRCPYPVGRCAEAASERSGWVIGMR
ncbi:MAG TPA: ABC transporter ATP-binding protein, partial [Desulfotomaculum sp.]|nr:ABC transporter ATP-binding protein [Desulfotomaculum sp.]